MILCEQTLGNTGIEHTLSSNFAKSENLRHLSEQNSNFGDARRITTENALTDLYIYLSGTKIFETIDTAAVQQTVVKFCRAVLFRAIKTPQKCCQYRFHIIAETEIHTESKQSQKKLLTTST